MARQETDREDLMREATALKQRAKWKVPHEPEPVIVGYRTNGCLSVYFGPDPVFHFDELGRLRRAFLDGALHRTQGSTLARLTRKRTESSTILERRDLNSDQYNKFVQYMRIRLENLIESFNQGHARLLEQIPPAADLHVDVVITLEQVCANVLHGNPLSPPYLGKR